MPCNKLAVQAAKLGISPRLIQAIFASPTALQALREMLAQATGEKVSVWNDQRKTSWVQGYRASQTAWTDHQHIPLDQIARADAGYMDFGFNGGCLRLYADGRIEARDGWRPSQVRKDMDALTATFAQIAAQTAIYMAQNLIADTLRQTGAVVADQRQAAGRILTLNL